MPLNKEVASAYIANYLLMYFKAKICNILQRQSEFLFLFWVPPCTMLSVQIVYNLIGQIKSETDMSRRAR